MKLNNAMIRTARDRKGWTQTQLAEKAKVALTTVCKAENEGEIYGSTGRKICRALGVEIAEAVIPTVNGNSDAA